jgi:hypothetical protein
LKKLKFENIDLKTKLTNLESIKNKLEAEIQDLKVKLNEKEKEIKNGKIKLKN